MGFVYNDHMVPLLTSILLISLSIPVVMRYRIVPIDGTPYWLFGILFLLLVIHFVLSLFPKIIKTNIYRERLRTMALWLVLTIVVVGATVTAIVDRNKTAPVLGVHDIILQQEAAMRFLLQGKNPYKETYFGTPLEQFHYDEMGKSATNPALYHFVMPPWYVEFPFVFYFFATPALGYFDGRMVLLASMIVTLVFIRRLFSDKYLGELAIVLTALSPATIDYFIEGRSDMFALVWLVVSLYLLVKQRWGLSAIFFGLGLMSKQTIWIAAPFYIGYLWRGLEKNRHAFFAAVTLMMVVIIVIAGPFLLWDFGAFMASTVWYLSGNTVQSYPVSGYGFGMLLYEFGFIKDLHAYYPFGVWQALVGVPIVSVTLRWLFAKPRLSKLIIGYAATLLGIWYFSRYFNNSHLGYLSTLTVLGAIMHVDEQGSQV